ncbi:hypothetical protein OAE37_04090 [Pirellulaceae bacterium]|nr:hypothetical protein [Pirellulaceae bacterium]
MKNDAEFVASDETVDAEERLSKSKESKNPASSGKTAPRKKRTSSRKYRTLFCSSCWRDEGHIPLIKSVPVIVVLTILTLGTYLLFRTYKCRLCGNERMASGE